jgi:hypothetical protein
MMGDVQFRIARVVREAQLLVFIQAQGRWHLIRLYPQAVGVRVSASRVGELRIAPPVICRTPLLVS